MFVFFFTSSRFVGPPLASARSGLLPRDTAGGQRDCQRNRTPATAQPIPTQAGCCPSVQGDLNRYHRPHCSYCESDMYNRSFSSQSLDFSTKRMIHEGPLTWKVNKDKQIGQRISLDTWSLMGLVSYPFNHTSLRPSHQRFKHCCCQTASSFYRGARTTGCS